MIRLAVIGDPVAHSRSPELHRGFLAEACYQGTYEAIRVAAGDGARAIDELRAAGFTGLNVTTPLKEEAFAASETRDASAAAAGAVNTLVLGDTVAGYNTDGAGAIGALAAAGMPDVAGRAILILGAGPTARATVAALVEAKARPLVWNRTEARAARLAADFACARWTPDASLDAAFSTLLPDSDLRDDGLLAALRAVPTLIDANYGDRATLAAALGRHVHDGRAMLEASARASFRLFTATRP